MYDEDKNTLLPRAKKKADKYSQKYLSSYNVEYDAVRPTVKKREPNTAINHAIIFPVLVGASPTALPVCPLT